MLMENMRMVCFYADWSMIDLVFYLFWRGEFDFEAVHAVHWLVGFSNNGLLLV